ncbi:protein suppressor of hairy wing [Drosophila biarmipes]|uniref:protein suppressor of hairy wing n=1 Tax=Drosophila biarmipes TaxID=125945 RepID=UPI0007E72FFF|nr:protein suppressor of hairy wing [Drosophila biarmipes]
MEFCSELSGLDEDSIEPCRTCGIYFTIGLDMDQAIVKPIFGLDDAAVTGMVEIVEQLSAWNIQVSREDGRPQYMCNPCIAEFQRLLKFKRSCLETQEQYGELEYQREQIVIKREIDPEEQKFCGFIYLDTDEEEISDEDGSRRVCAAFDIPHVPIKEEHMARVPVPSSSEFQPPEAKELALPVESGFDMMDHDALTASMFASSSEDASGIADDGDNEDDEDIVKFTYDDDGDASAPLPLPIYSPMVSCKLCLHESPDQEAHLDHMRRTHLLKDWECHICAKKFTNAQESRIKFHIKYHKLQRHIKCPVCGFICNSKETLKEHRQAVHARTKCTYCGKTVKNAVLQSHLKKHLRDGEAELAQKLKLLEQPPENVSNTETFPTPLFASSLETTVDGEASLLSNFAQISDSTMPEDSNVFEDSELVEEPNASPDSKHLENTTQVRQSPFAIDPPEEIQYPMDPPAPVDVPVPSASSLSVPTVTVIQCAFCSDTFEEAQLLQAHVLAAHTKTRKRPRSPENTPPMRKTRQGSYPKEAEQASTKNKESSAHEGSSAQKDSTAQQESRTEKSLNGSSTAEQVPEKSYMSCHVCGKSFDLKIKLNRHLKQHNTLPH